MICMTCQHRHAKVWEDPCRSCRVLGEDLRGRAESHYQANPARGLARALELGLRVDRMPVYKRGEK